MTNKIRVKFLFLFSKVLFTRKHENLERKGETEVVHQASTWKAVQRTNHHCEWTKTSSC